jgi:2,5-diketo-D-gluconate reductase B
MKIPTKNGIPIIGFGTYPLNGQACIDIVAMALELGFNHIDTAQMYGNEKAVGTAIRQSGLPRESLFVVTKFYPGATPAREIAASVDRSTGDLGGPVDLLLIHWPPADQEMDAVLDCLAAEKAKGNTKAIGVSNFSPSMLAHAQARLGNQIICNQVEFHPLLDQRKLLASAEERGIVLTAYSPLARGAAMQPDTIVSIARKHNRAPSEVVLRWIIQQGVVAIPMTTKRENMLSNLEALRFELDAGDMEAISALGTKQGRTIQSSAMKGRWDE